MMNKERLMIINNFHGCQVTITYQLSQTFSEPRRNVPQAESDDCLTLIDKPVKNFHSLELRFTDIRVQFHHRCVMCVMFERLHV